MWFEFFLFGLVLSGPVWIYQNTQGRGNILELPLWMQKSWESLLSGIYSLSIIVFVVFGFIVDGTEEESFVDGDGDRWYSDEYGDRSYMWEYK